MTEIPNKPDTQYSIGNTIEAQNDNVYDIIDIVYSSDNGMWQYLAIDTDDDEKRMLDIELAHEFSQLIY